MSKHIALYRKWRPLTFSDVIGQEHVTRTLKNEVISKKTGHAFLFCGGRGTGKTSTARILSRALNCLNPKDGDPCNECSICKGILSGEIMDIIEIDAASNNGVENIRDLRSEARFAAAEASYKVYIIDEVHMLSTGAFNALLKLLEEPPEGVIFILATTETQKVPATILSRCQRFDFKRITAYDIAQRLSFVAAEEGISLDEGAAHLIAVSADGALRDALSILDQISALSEKITEDDVYSLLGLTEKNFLYRIVRSIATNDTENTLSMVDEFIESGKSAAKLIDSLNDYFTTLLRFSVSETVFSDYTEEETEELRLASSEMSKERMMFSIETLIKAASSLKYLTSDRVVLDMAVIKMCNPSYVEGNDALILRISELEKKLASGNFTSPMPRELPEVKKEKPKTEKRIVKDLSPKSGDILLISEKWKDICKDTKDLRLLISLMHSSVKEDNGNLVILLDNQDKIMLDILSEDKVKESLSELITKHTGLSPKIVPRLKSYYEEEVSVSENDPLNLINEDSFGSDAEDSIGDNDVSLPASPVNSEEEAEEEYDFEEDIDDNEEY